MIIRLLPALILVPIAEIYLLVKAGSYIGAFNIAAIVILTGLGGAYLARLEGAQIFHKIRQSLQQGRIPSAELVDALLVFIAGTALLLPGFLTDLAGLVLLLPPGRAMVRKKLMEWIRDRAGRSRVYIRYDV